MKTTTVTTRAGSFKIILAVKGKRGSEPKALKHALSVALNRIARSERRQGLLRKRRSTEKRARKSKR